MVRDREEEQEYQPHPPVLTVRDRRMIAATIQATLEGITEMKDAIADGADPYDAVDEMAAELAAAFSELGLEVGS